MWKIALAALILVSAAPALAAEDAQEQANRKLVLEMVDTLFVRHEVDKAIDAYFDPGYIQHNPGAASGAEAIRGFFKSYYARVPTATVSVKRVLADGDLVAVHYNGVSGPGDRGSAVVDIFRIANGRIAEHWDVVQRVPETAANQNGMF